MYWKISTNRSIVVNSLAGYTNKLNYSKIQINRKVYFTHRLIFLYHHGHLPEFLDHIDGNPLNNKIENLRGCTRGQNNCNRRIDKNSTSGVKGVTWYKPTNKWRSMISAKGKKIHIGYFNRLQDAKTAIASKRNELHGEFANHG